MVGRWQYIDMEKSFCTECGISFRRVPYGSLPNVATHNAWHESRQANREGFVPPF